ncbi:hypothetical protein GCM10022221_09940 [Actinocorallia aurea]
MPDVLSELFTLHPAPPRYRSAAIAGVCTAVPVLLGTAFHQAGLGLVASTGALAALYGGHGTARQDATAVAGAGTALAAGMAAGSSMAGQTWPAVAGTALFTCLVTAVFALVHARPPGIVMPVLVCSVGTGLPAGDTVPRTAAVAVVAGCAAVLTGAAAWSRDHRSPPVAASVRVRDAWGELVEFARSPVPLTAVRAATAVGLAGSVSLLCQIGRPYWAMAAAGAILGRGSHAAGANARALSRGAGTAAGCLLAGGLAALHPHGVVLAVLLAALTWVTELIVIRNYALAMVFVTPLAVLLATAAAAPQASVTEVTADRLAETVLGCLGAVAVGQLVTRHWAVAQRRHAIAAVLRRTAELLERADGNLWRLRYARTRLALVTERTAGERRSIRAAAAGLDPVAAAAHQLAEQAMTGALTDREAAPDMLRTLAGFLDADRARSEDQPLARLPEPLSDLGRAVQVWLTATTAPAALSDPAP